MNAGDLFGIGFCVVALALAFALGVWVGSSIEITPATPAPDPQITQTKLWTDCVERCVDKIVSRFAVLGIDINDVEQEGL